MRLKFKKKSPELLKIEQDIFGIGTNDFSTKRCSGRATCSTRQFVHADPAHIVSYMSDVC